MKISQLRRLALFVLIGFSGGFVRAEGGAAWRVTDRVQGTNFEFTVLSEALAKVSELGDGQKTIRPLVAAGKAVRGLDCALAVSNSNTIVDFAPTGSMGRAELVGSFDGADSMIRVAQGAKGVVLENIDFGIADCPYAVFAESGAEVTLLNCRTTHGQAVAAEGAGDPADTVLMLLGSRIASTNELTAAVVAVSNATLNVGQGTAVLAQYELSDVRQPDGVRAIEARDSLVNVLDGATIAGGRWGSSLVVGGDVTNLYLNCDSEKWLMELPYPAYSLGGDFFWSFERDVHPDHLAIDTVSNTVVKVRYCDVANAYGMVGSGTGIWLDGGTLTLQGGSVGVATMAVVVDDFIEHAVRTNVDRSMAGNFAETNHVFQYGSCGWNGVRLERGNLVVPADSTCVIDVGNCALSINTNGSVRAEDISICGGQFGGYSYREDSYHLWVTNYCVTAFEWSWFRADQGGSSLESSWGTLGEFFSVENIAARFGGRAGYYSWGDARKVSDEWEEDGPSTLEAKHKIHYGDMNENDILWSWCASNVVPYCYYNFWNPELTPDESEDFPYGVCFLEDDDFIFGGIGVDGDSRVVYWDEPMRESFAAEPDRHSADVLIFSPTGIDGWNFNSDEPWADRKISYVVKDAYGFVATNFISAATQLTNGTQKIGVIVEPGYEDFSVLSNGYGRAVLPWHPTVTCEEMYLCASNRANGVAEADGVTYIEREITVYWDGKLPGEGGRANTYRVRFDPSFAELGNPEVPDPLDGCAHNAHSWPRQHRVKYLSEDTSIVSNATLSELFFSCEKFSELEAIQDVSPLLDIWPAADEAGREFLGWRLADAGSDETILLSPKTWADVDWQAVLAGDLLAVTNAVTRIPRYTRSCLTAEPIWRTLAPVGWPSALSWGAVAWSDEVDSSTVVRFVIPDLPVDLEALKSNGFTSQPVRVYQDRRTSVEPRFWLCDGTNEFATLAEAFDAGATNAVPVFEDADGNALPPRSVSEIVLNATSTKLLSTVWENAPLPEGLPLSAAVCATNVEGLADVARTADSNVTLVVSAKRPGDVAAADELELAVSNRLERAALGETISFCADYFNLAGKVGGIETDEFSSAVQVTVPWPINTRILYSVSRCFGGEIECLPERSGTDGDEWYELNAEKGTITLSVRRLGDFALGALVQDTFCLVVVHDGGKSLGCADPLSVATNFTLTVTGLEYSESDFGGFAYRASGEHAGEYAINFFFTRKPGGFDIGGKLKVIPGVFTITDDGQIVSKWAAEDEGYPGKGYGHVRLGCDPATGKVKGEKVYKLGKKASINATPAKGYVFAGWYEDPGFSKPASFWTGTGKNAKPKDYRNASQSFVVTDNTYLFARFVEKTSTADPISWLRYEGAGYCGADASWLAEEETWYQGVALPTNACQIAFGSLSLPTVRVSGLPSGVKFDKATCRFTGAPMACSTVKKPFFTVTVLAKNKAGATDKIVKKIEVKPLPVWGVGNFAGACSEAGVEKGLFTATIGKTGKFSGKVKVADPKVTATLSMKCFSGVEKLGDALYYFVEPTVKYKDPATKKTVTAVGSLTLADGVGADAGRGVLVGEDEGVALRAVQKLKK